MSADKELPGQMGTCFYTVEPHPRQALCLDFKPLPAPTKPVKEKR